MKIFYSFMCMLLFTATSYAQVDLPITFEDSSIDYVLQDFDGNTSMLFTDPTDPNNTVVQATKGLGAQSWAGTTVGNDGLENPIPFSMGQTKMTVRVWSPTADTPILLKVENTADGSISVETLTNTTTAMAWETLEFDFNNNEMGTPPIDFANTYDKVSIFFNFGTDGDTAGEQTYYFDDITFFIAPPPPVDLPITFENDAPNYYDVLDFGGNASMIVTDPTDPNNKVMQSLRETTATTFAGTIIGNSGLANPLAFTETDKKISVRVWSPEAGVIIRLKVENSASAATFAEVDMTSTVTADWETIVFDFENVSGGNLDLANDYDKVVMFFNFGIPGTSAGEQIYYWDDVQFVQPLMPDLPITFEDGATVDYNLGNFGNNVSMVVTDPTDPNNTVAETFKPNNAEPWAGVVAGDDGLATPIPFTDIDKKMSLRVWSPDAGITVKLKVEDAADAGIFAEVDMPTTVAEQWETIEFDFNNLANGNLDLANTYNKVVVFFNFDVTGVGDKTYYWDDVMFLATPPPTEPDLPLTFESSTIDYNLVDFGNNVSMIVADPTDPNNTVVETLKPNNAETWSGTVAGDAGLVNPVPFADNAKTMSMRVWSPDAGIIVKLKVEDAADANIFAEVDMPTTVAEQWETIEFDFNNPVNGSIDLANTYNKVVAFFNFDVTGVGDKTYYWDDIMFIPPVLDPVDLPITFEDINIDYNLVDFEGNASMILEDPTDPNNTVGQIFKDLNAGTSAGTTVGGAGLVNPIPFTSDLTKMTVRVWSPTAGTPVRLKVEDVTDPTKSVETEVNTTTAMAWETLVFDFDNEAPGTAEIDLSYTYNMVSIFFNFGTDGATAGEQTYYFDDVMFDTTPPLNQVDLPVTFEDPMVDYNFIDFGEATSQLVVDPTNPLNMVMETTKPETAVEWAGTIIGNDDGFVNDVPFSATEQKMNVRVWSPQADIPVLLKMENTADGGIFVETLTNTTKAMEWETLEFDFSNPTATSPALDLTQVYDKGVIFFNFGTTGADAGSLTFYWDDVQFGAIDVSVNNVEAANIKVSPNPANDFINIEFPEAIEAVTTATLMDVSGKVMLYTDINNRFSQINTADLSAGTYFLRIDTTTGSYYQKVMIVR